MHAHPILSSSENGSGEPMDVKSDFLAKTMPARKSARLTSAILNYSRPDGLNLVPLGTSWAVDIFARLNNGARRSFIDLYNMIDAMQHRVSDLRTSELKLFLHWWHLFASSGCLS